MTTNVPRGPASFKNIMATSFGPSFVAGRSEALAIVVTYDQCNPSFTSDAIRTSDDLWSLHTAPARDFNSLSVCNDVLFVLLKKATAGISIWDPSVTIPDGPYLIVQEASEILHRRCMWCIGVNENLHRKRVNALLTWLMFEMGPDQRRAGNLQVQALADQSLESFGAVVSIVVAQTHLSNECQCMTTEASAQTPTCAMTTVAIRNRTQLVLRAVDLRKLRCQRTAAAAPSMRC
jgi:hypothetical protein